MKNKFILILLLVISWQCNSNAQARLKSGSETTMYPPHELIRNKMSAVNIPGMQVCVIGIDTVLWHHNYGYANLNDSTPVTDSTLFNAFSIGKSITGAQVLQLQEKGMIGLDENICHIVPFNLDNPYLDYDSVSIRMLMTHTSSIKDYNFENHVVLGDPAESLASFIANYLDPEGDYYSLGNFMIYPGGTAYSYTNIGIGLNGYLVEVLSGIDFDQHVHDSIFIPLDMQRTCFFISDLNIYNLAIGYDPDGSPNPHYGCSPYPGVSMRSRALELSNFAIMMINDGIFRGKRILEKGTIDSMCVVQYPTLSNSGLGLYQYQLQNIMDTVWGHAGGGTLGYAAHLLFNRDEHTAVVVMTNSSTFVFDIMDELFTYAKYLRDSTTVHTDDIGFNENITSLNIQPNPFRDQCQISYELPVASHIKLEIFDLHGNRVAEILSNQQPAGKREVIFNTGKLRPGIYICRLQCDKNNISKKIIRL